MVVINLVDKGFKTTKVFTFNTTNIIIQISYKMIYLDDYFESIEYVPIELRQGFTSIRELDLQVHNAMDSLDKNFKEFFDKVHTLTPQQKQDQYSNLLVKCDEVMTAASDKVRVADSLHELIEKCRRHLDIGLEKLREDLKEGDKADIIEELERRSKEEDDLYQQEQEQMIAQQKQLQKQLQQKQQQQLTLSQTTSNTLTNNKNNNSNHNNNYQNQIYSQNNHQSNNSTTKTNVTTPRLNNTNKQQSSGNSANNQKQTLQKKREKKRLNNNNNMSIFNSNSHVNGASFSQTNLDYINSLTPSNSQTNKNNHNNKIHSCHTPSANLNKQLLSAVNHNNHQQQQQIRTNHNNISHHYSPDNNNKFNNNKSRSNIDQHPSLTPQHHAHIHNSQILQSPSSSFSTTVKDKNQSSISRANQQISLISAITAVNAVSPTPSFSDKKMISSNPNGDILATSVINMNKISPLTTNPSHTSTTTTNTTLNNLQLASAAGLVTNANTIAYNQLTQGVMAGSMASTSLNRKQYSDKNYQMNNCRASGDSYPSTNLVQNSSSSATHLHCHDPIVAAASQAINATQQMQQGRRTSSLKASYAAVNSGGLQNISGGMLVPSQQQQHHHNLQQQQKDGSPNNNNPLSTFNYHPYNQAQQETIDHQGNIDPTKVLPSLVAIHSLVQ